MAVPVHLRALPSAPRPFPAPVPPRRVSNPPQAAEPVVSLERRMRCVTTGASGRNAVSVSALVPALPSLGVSAAISGRRGGSMRRGGPSVLPVRGRRRASGGELIVCAIGGSAGERAAPLSPSSRNHSSGQGHATSQFNQSSSSSGSDSDSATSAVAEPLRSSSSRPRIRGLRADDIRHPLDRQNTALLRAIPGLNDLGRVLLGPVQEQILVLENLGSGVLVSPQQLPSLHALMVDAAAMLDMPSPPDLYVRQSPVPNAYTLAINGQKPFVVVHTALLDLLTPLEVQAVLAHELGHLKCEHGLWLTFANLLALGAASSLPGFLGAMLARGLEDQLLRWLRAAELTCDRAALVVVRDPRVVVSVLMKLAGGSTSGGGSGWGMARGGGSGGREWGWGGMGGSGAQNSAGMAGAGGNEGGGSWWAEELSVDAFLAQARSYDEAANSGPLAWYLRNAQTRQLAHPLPVLRAREVDRWARSPEFKALMGRSYTAAGKAAGTGGGGGAGGGSGKPVTSKVEGNESGMAGPVKQLGGRGMSQGQSRVGKEKGAGNVKWSSEGAAFGERKVTSMGTGKRDWWSW